MSVRSSQKLHILNVYQIYNLDLSIQYIIISSFEVHVIGACDTRALTFVPNVFRRLRGDNQYAALQIFSHRSPA